MSISIQRPGAGFNILNLTGIQDHLDGIVTLNTDISKINILPCKYFIHGNAYYYDGGTALIPNIAIADSSTWVGLNSAGLVYSPDKFTNGELETILPLARLQSVQGTSGPGSNLLAPLDLRYTIGEEGWINRRWLTNVIGALYPSDGDDGIITENGTESLQLDQAAGTMYDSQRKPITITQKNNIAGKKTHHVSGSWRVQDDAIISVPLFYDDQTNLVELGNNKWASHTLLRAPKDEDQFIFVISQAEYASQAEAEAAPPSYGLFGDQATSTLFPVASVIVRGNSTGIESFVDRRPKIHVTAGAVIGQASLQQTYDNSVSPEIITDDTRGAFTVQDGTDVLTALNYEGKNFAGDTTFSVDASGALIAYNVKKAKFDATVAPGTSNDNTEGYAVGSVWIDITAGNMYVCVDATTSAAVWKITT